MGKQDIDPLVKLELEELGAVLVRHKKHYVFWIEGVGNIIISKSPSDHRVTQKNLQLIRTARKKLKELRSGK